jgi:hypothetical protein
MADPLNVTWSCFVEVELSLDLDLHAQSLSSAHKTLPYPSPNLSNFNVMAVTSSPRKLVIPLASGDESKPLPSTTGPNLTKRVFYCGVVVEGSENGRRLPDGLYLLQWDTQLLTDSTQKFKISYCRLEIPCRQQTSQKAYHQTETNL